MDSKKAKDNFINGYACSQAVLDAYCDKLGLDKDVAFKIASGFGGGMGSTGHTCGAVSGAVAVLGLMYSESKIDGDSKQKVRARVKDFIDEFKSQHSSIDCRKLLGYNIDIPAERQIVNDERITAKVCPALVESSVNILESIKRKVEKED